MLGKGLFLVKKETPAQVIARSIGFHTHRQEDSSSQHWFLMLIPQTLVTYA